MKYYHIGNNQHQGSSSKPREFAIDDLIIPQPPAEEFIRVHVICYCYNLYSYIVIILLTVQKYKF